MASATLYERGFVLVGGDEAEAFLQSLITTDLATVGIGEARPGALLSPQGKILFDFLVGRSQSGLLIETDAAQVESLIKRLTMYRLRARVTLEKRPESQTTVRWDAPAEDGALRDMRFERAGIALWRHAGAGGQDDVSAYRSLRMRNGISGGGEDGGLGDYFPHDLLLDRNGGLSFKKGCYIGQEVVSRIQHRATARKRLVRVTAGQALGDAGALVLAGEREIGTLLAAEGGDGLAVVRIDKAGTALANGTPITVDGSIVSLALPAWSGLDFPDGSDEAVP